MTCILSWLDKTGGYVVSDRRIVTDGGSLTSDTQSKYWATPDQSMLVAYAGSVGHAQVWLRRLAEGVGLLESLPGHDNPEFSFVCYDSVGHRLYHGDSSGFLIVKHELTGIGSGAAFAMGYLAGTGKKVSPELARKAVRAASKTDLSVSAGSDVTFVARQRKRT